MIYVFGKTLICRNMDVATKFARQHGLDCITLDGDQVGYKNYLSKITPFFRFHDVVR